MKKTPLEAGFKMPAEWKKHRATWIGWCSNKNDFPGKIAPIHWVYGEITRKLIEGGETVAILVQDEKHQAKAKSVLNKVGANFDKIEFHQIPHNRGWMRDSGPMFVKNDETGEIAVIKFSFNAWAKYDDWKLDNQVAIKYAKSNNRKLFEVEYKGQEVVLEWGAIDVNGAGTLLTTEECLLDYKTQCRNPHLSREDYEQVFRQNIGATNTLWLYKGIVGDDTHGHIDDFCRFVDKKTIVLAEEKNENDPNHRILEENRERLEGFRLEDGSKVNLVRLPMPAPLIFDGQRLPASYANFYIANESVLVPTFNDENDRIALGILAEHFPTRKVVGIHAVDLVWGLGTLHCLTQQEPT
ncbi:MAG TPA: agmatine deiminase family protein [Pyrinomonadaceae bacterium]|nr:agmatine deiminase family protein [Pyrinomonadaceae bacterium]